VYALEAKITNNKNCTRGTVLSRLKLTTDRHEALHGLSATASKCYHLAIFSTWPTPAILSCHKYKFYASVSPV